MIEIAPQLFENRTRRLAPKRRRALGRHHRIGTPLAALAAREARLRGGDCVRYDNVHNQPLKRIVVLCALVVVATRISLFPAAATTAASTATTAATARTAARGRRPRVFFDPVAHLGAHTRLVRIVVVAAHKQDLEVRCTAQARDLVAARRGSRGSIPGGERVGRETVFPAPASGAA